MRDVGSLNGTYVNRERIEEAVLAIGRRGADRQVQARLPGGGGRVSAAGRDTVSSRTYLSIGDVLALLRQEFPDVTISKIRFLESQGLVNPERTPSGYRKFYEHDVERLRWVLRQQREHFLPLKVIKGRLEQEVPSRRRRRLDAPAERRPTGRARAAPWCGRARVADGPCPGGEPAAGREGRARRRRPAPPARRAGRSPRRRRPAPVRTGRRRRPWPRRRPPGRRRPGRGPAARRATGRERGRRRVGRDGRRGGTGRRRRGPAAERPAPPGAGGGRPARRPPAAGDRVGPAARPRAGADRRPTAARRSGRRCRAPP